MLNIPTADELMTNQCKVPHNHEGKIAWANDAQASKFLRKMKAIQRRMILRRHYLDMDPATKRRADAVLNGTYHGIMIPTN